MALRLSIFNELPLKIDLSSYKTVQPDPLRGIRIPGIQHFNISAQIATAYEIRSYVNGWRAQSRRLLEFWKPYYKRRFIVEPEAFHFRPDPNLLVLRVRRTTYLLGFWQTEKYFLDIQDKLRRELTVKHGLSGQDADLAKIILSSNSVCIHIRHGDNATPVAQHLGVLPLRYYYEASEFIAAKVNNPIFFVFSDDPTWAQSNLKLNHPLNFVTHNDDETNYEDLRLMSLCHHHILANSTFSWWGAWLGRKSGQIVYAPKQYYQKLNRPNPDFYPDSWETI